MAFSESFLDELIGRNDIADVVNTYVRLTKKSGSNLFGLCPFHSEKTPSFSVNSEKQIYHCFGCGKGGGVINFIMEIENLDFPDAVQFLAKRVGMTVPDDTTPLETRNRRVRMLELNRDAARFFYEMLSAPQGLKAVEYINKREISKAMVKRFGLGAAPDSWNTLLNEMKLKGYTDKELIDAGLVKVSRNRSDSMYDVFRNRLMFPVIDVRGSVIGFSGRILDDGEPKYLNSPDTPVFSKSKNLFALNIAKRTKSGMLILAEGNIDVISLHQAGFDSAVASLGTSLTEDQARLMSRYTKNVVLAYDSDEAGVKASSRAIAIFEKVGLGVKVIRVPGAKDPDEYIKKFGADSFSLLIERSENHIEYRLLTIKGKYDLETDEGRLGYLSEATEMLAGVDNAIEREVYGAHVADAVGISAEAVRTEIKKAFRKRVSIREKRRAREEMRVAASLQPADKAIRYENVISAAAEEGVIRLLILDPTLFREADKQGITADDFSSPFLAKIYEILERRRSEGTDVTPALLMSELKPEEAAQLSVIMQKPESLSEAEKAMRDYSNKIKTEQIKKTAKEDLLSFSEKCREIKGYDGGKRYG